ncbi:MAG: sulfate reduction electron transfer complex DsrMKJOP subunit DsrJ [Thermoanaerobacteraceae bacterium]|nr:sulfate reduction electron transfer complex DsrMKJOP subunit DsrJ [Thermoanaerobacteraceae bacterium]
MYKSRNILAGLIIFIAMATFPFWSALGNDSVAPVLELDTPAINQLEEKQCVESRDFMRRRHMELLMEWKNAVAREGMRIYRASDGKTYDMSLQNTCLKCHSNKEEFCDRCHDYAGVKPVCWSCHLEAKGDE